MIESMLVGICAVLFIGGIFQIMDAWSVARLTSWQPPPELKWGRGGKTAFLIVATLILASAVSYLVILNWLGVLQ